MSDIGDVLKTQIEGFKLITEVMRKHNKAIELLTQNYKTLAVGLAEIKRPTLIERILNWFADHRNKREDTK